MTPRPAPNRSDPSDLDPPSLNPVVRYAFGAAEILPALAFVLLNSWALYFLVNVAAMPPILAGIAFLIGRVVDAVLDILVGRWSDRVRHSHGRLVFVRWGLVPTAVSFVALWWLPVIAEGEVARFVLAVAGFTLFSFFYTLISIPRFAMIPALATTPHARTKLVVSNMSFVFVSVLAAIAVTPALVLAFSDTEALAAAPATAWIATAALFALIGVLATLPALRLVPDPKDGAIPGAPARWREELGSLWRTPGFVRLVLAFVLTVIATLLVQSMTPFYLESVLAVPGAAQAPILGGIFVLAIISFPLWGLLSKRTGKRNALLLGIAVYGVFLVMVPLLPAGSGVSVPLVVACLFAGAGVSALNLFPGAMLPDTIEADTRASGERREALFYAVYLFAQKIAGSLAVFWNGIMLWAFDHRAGAVVQDAATLDAFVWMTGPVPLAVLVLAALVIVPYAVEPAKHPA